VKEREEERILTKVLGNPQGRKRTFDLFGRKRRIGSRGSLPKKVGSGGGSP